MKLRNKILAGIVITWAVFLLLTLGGSHYFLTQSFIHLEKERVIRDTNRVKEALEQIDYSLYTFTSDWSHWNDLYSYMQGKNKHFVSDNFTIPAFVNSKINLLTYWNNQKKLVLSAFIDTDNGKYTDMPKGFINYVSEDSTIFSELQKNTYIRSYILLPSGVMFISGSLITDGNDKQKPLGYAISGRYLSEPMIQQVSTITKLPLQLLSINDIKQNDTYQNYFNTLSGELNETIVHPIDDRTIESLFILRDVNKKPIAMFRITEPRSIYLTGLEAVQYYFINLIILSVLFTLIMLWLLRILIIKRLENLASDVTEISKHYELSKRMDTRGNDELSFVALAINKMMSIIQSSHEKLETRVHERTQELQKTNIQLQNEIIERQSIENELINHKEYLVKLAHYDNLTSLPNRVLFNEMLNKAINHANRHHKQLAVLFIDLDRFKKVNDALGHTVGDLLLKEVASRFSSALRAEDMLARLGGDEFIILLNDINHPKFAGPVAEKLLQICAKAVHIDNHELFVTTSIGICIYPNDGTSLEDLQRNADMAMYKAKKHGGNAYRYFTHQMNIEAHEHIKLESALRKALLNNELVLHYQPQYNLSDGTLSGVEALIRWDSPTHGLIDPGRFIPLAEETGLILPIGEWALREACRANKSWQEKGFKKISVAVNISPKQFRHQDIAQLVANVLEETKLAPEYLEIEITETAVMDDITLAITKLNEINAMGVKVAIDDFGTGYTSISNLKLYPVSVLKIDQHFIQGIPNNYNDTAIIVAMIALAHTLHIKVIAEGVETAEQLQYLADNDCDLVQGYYLSRPLPESKLIVQFSEDPANDTIID